MQELSHSEYKYIVRLIKNSHFKRSENKVFIEGNNSVRELYTNNKKSIYLILITDKTLNQYKGENVVYANENVVRRLSSRAGGFDSAVVVDTTNIERTLPTELKSFSLGLVNIQDPGNLGTIFRTAEAFGVKSIFLFEGCADPLNQKSLDASLGSVLKVPFYRINTIKDFNDKYTTIQKIGTFTDANTSYKDFKPKQDFIVFFGNEGKGLSKEIINQLDNTINIPIDNIGSLNVAVSVGIICAQYTNLK